MAYNGFCAHHGPWQGDWCDRCGRDATRHTDPELATELWDMAVEAVDARHGYSVEFSNSPEAHRLQYHEELDRLLDEIGPGRHDIIDVAVDGEPVTLAIRRRHGDPPLTEKDREAFEALAAAAARHLDENPGLAARQEEKLRSITERVKRLQEGTDA